MRIDDDGNITNDADYKARCQAAFEFEIQPGLQAVWRSDYGRRLFDELVDVRCEGDATGASIVFELSDGTLIGVPFALMGREH